MKTVSFSGNQVIFREGDAAETMYEIRSGRVGIFSSYGADGEKQIASGSSPPTVRTEKSRLQF